MDTDLDGHKTVVNGLRKIKGVSFMYANMILAFSGVDKFKKVGDLQDSEVEALEKFMKDPLGNGAPVWMLNRRKDIEDGSDRHIYGSDIRFVKDNDLKLMRMTKSYKGLRHNLGLPVRGQRTKSNFRKNKGKGLGVKRKR